MSTAVVEMDPLIPGAVGESAMCLSTVTRGHQARRQARSTSRFLGICLLSREKRIMPCAVETIFFLPSSLPPPYVHIHLPSFVPSLVGDNNQADSPSLKALSLW